MGIPAWGGGGDLILIVKSRDGEVASNIRDKLTVTLTVRLTKKGGEGIVR